MKNGWWGRWGDWERCMGLEENGKYCNIIEMLKMICGQMGDGCDKIIRKKKLGSGRMGKRESRE